MSEKEESGFSWQILYFVTGISGFGFDLIIKLLDGHHTPFLLWTALIATSFGIISLLISFFAHGESKK